MTSSFVWKFRSPKFLSTLNVTFIFSPLGFKVYLPQSVGSMMASFKVLPV